MRHEAMGRGTEGQGSGARQAGARPVLMGVLAMLLAATVTGPARPGGQGAVVEGGAPGGSAGSGSTPITTTVVYVDTGQEQRFVVPPGVTRLHVVAVGAGGERGADSDGQGGAGSGGRGAIVGADLPVTPGATLYLEVGDNEGANDFGAASDLRTCSRTAPARACDTLRSRLLVAGGGGGGGEGPYDSAVPGGDGVGGDAGRPGALGAGDYPGGGGAAGTIRGGGAGGYGEGGSGTAYDGTPGTAGTAGTAGTERAGGTGGAGGMRDPKGGAGGAGGAGYYGGGGGGGGASYDGESGSAGTGYGGGGGGGGSNFVTRRASRVIISLAPRGTSPTVTISYARPHHSSDARPHPSETDGSGAGRGLTGRG